MRLLALAPSVLVLLATALAPPAAAAANGCALYNPAPPVPIGFPVPGPYLNTLGPGPCNVAPVLGSPGPAPLLAGLQFTSAMPPCPPAFVGALPGEFCGPVVPAFTAVVCTAQAAVQPGTFDPLVGLVVGLDYDANGHILQVAPTDHEPLRHDNVPDREIKPRLFSVLIENPLPVDARVIAYPIVNPQQFGGPILVNCQ